MSSAAPFLFFGELRECPWPHEAVRVDSIGGRYRDTLDTSQESLNASKAKVPFENEHFWKQKRSDRDQPESAGAPRIEDVGHPLPAFSDASGVGSAAFCYHEETRIAHQSDSERRSTP
jgi:hypothetical protein